MRPDVERTGVPAFVHGGRGWSDSGNRKGNGTFRGPAGSAKGTLSRASDLAGVSATPAPQSEWGQEPGDVQPCVFTSLGVPGSGSQMCNGQSSLRERSCTPPRRQPTGSLHLGMVSAQPPAFLILSPCSSTDVVIVVIAGV